MAKKYSKSKSSQSGGKAKKRGAPGRSKAKASSVERDTFKAYFLNRKKPVNPDTPDSTDGRRR